MHSHYKAGHLLEAGGIGEQPHWYCEGMQIVEAALNRLQRERAEEAAERQRHVTDRILGRNE